MISNKGLTFNHVATQRVVALVDMDCFYCQVETRLDPTLKGKPLAVVQYNQWKGGGIIAVNYEARDRGVTRHMRGDEAKEICPEIVLVRVPTIRGKADLSKNAGDEVAKVFSDFSDCVQRASIDEAYLDLTKAVEECIKNKDEIKSDDLPNTFVVGYSNSKNNDEDERKKGLTEWLKDVENQENNESSDYYLAVAGKIVENMRQEILNKTGFHCSAGIAHNKILAKLTAGLHKPKKQTIIPHNSILELYETLPIYKVKNLGGKLGKVVSEKLSINYMSELYKFSLQELQHKFDEKTGSWLYSIARGIDLDPVRPRLQPESIGCCKNFTGKNMLTTKSEVEQWLKELATEVSERLIKDLEKNKRRAKQMTVSFYQETAMSRCGPLNSYETNKIASDALDLIKKFNNAPHNTDAWNPPIKYLGLSVTKFSEEKASIEKYFKNCSNSVNTKKSEQDSSSNELPIKTTIESENNSEPVEVVNDNEEPGPSNDQPKPSFFLNFMSNKNHKDQDEYGSTESEDQQKDAESEEETWISLSEVFPDLTEAEPDIIEILPEPLKRKLEERLPFDLANDESHKAKMFKTCEKCGKSVPEKEILEHSDFHAALKLYSELNKVESVNTIVLAKNKTKEPESITKRKKKLKTPSKKMKNITNFFNVIPKQSNS